MRVRHWLGFAAVAFAALICARAQAEPRSALVIGNIQATREMQVPWDSSLMIEPFYFLPEK